MLLNGILLAALLTALANRSQGEDAVSYGTAKEERLEEVRRTCERTTENILTDLRFNQVSLVEDVATATFYLPLNMEEELWETGEITSGQPEVEILFEKAFTREDKQKAIREGTRFEFLAVRGGQYRSYYLVFTGLPIVSIETAETAETEIFGGSIRFWDANTKRDWFRSNILEAHIRGNTSRLYPKKGYKLSLKKQDREGNVVKDSRSLFGLREDDEYILNAMYTDASKIRDKLCADIWSGMGAYEEEFPDMRLGTDGTYVEVFFNGEYWGLYLLLEPVDSKQLDLKRETESKPSELAYKSSIPQNQTLEEMEACTEWTEEMGGYQLKGRYTEITRESWQPLLNYLAWSGTPEDEVFAAQAGEMVDGDNLLQLWTYLQAVMGIDNRVKNMYYVTKYTENGCRMYLAPWDMDLTLGDTLQDSVNEYPWDVGNNPMIYRERINFAVGDRMIKTNAMDAKERVSWIWRESREGVLSEEALLSAVDGLRHQVQDSGALRREGLRWPRGKHGEDYERMKTLLCYRMELLDGYFYDNLEAYLDLGYE